ncbi:MAG: alpha/beta hydrolase [Firmicutes bacterium]|nr:alpha/beta hydrolase [Alicyclobacillaceae bacterium]MCL6498261.1 alpha/beta hydrolase [Bacillota bacterium]
MIEPRSETLDHPRGPITVWRAGHGHPLLWLHPAGGFRWSLGLAQLAERYELVAPVAPGFDGTPLWPEVHSMSALADWVAEVHARTVEHPCPVVGHSFGGWLAMWYAVRHADQITRLVLMAPAGFRPPDSTVSLQDVARQLFVHPEKALPSDKSPQVEAGNREATRHYHGPSPRDEELAQRLSEITVPTLILRGARDVLIPHASMEEIQAGIGHAVVVQLPDGGHGLDTDQPEAYAHWIRAFLEGAV